MRTVTVVPGLVLDEELYGLAEAGLWAFAPGLVACTWEWFTDPANWALIPDPSCFGYKAELLLQRAAERTTKINLWMGPDLRAGETPKPHNHPWEQFTAHVLAGGYLETRYEPSPQGGAPVVQDRSHSAGGRNIVPKATFHEVIEVADPGRTLTLMDCGPGIQGQWGYMDPHTGEFSANEPDPAFSARLRQLNPQLR